MIEFPETPSPSPSSAKPPLSPITWSVCHPARCPLPAFLAPPSQTLPPTLPRSHLPVLPHNFPLYSLSPTTSPGHTGVSLIKMAKLTFSLLLLFFLIAFSESRTPSDSPNDDVSGRDVHPDLAGSEAESIATILLPSEKPESEAATVVLTDPETTATDSNARDAADVSVLEDRPVSEPEKFASVPLRMVTFRPYDHGGFRERTVPHSLRFPFRHGGRGCRHGHRQFRPRFPGREISFGNDMILSGEKPGSDPESRGFERQMPGRWIRVHHRKPRFGFADVAWKEDKDMMERPDRREEREGDEEREHPHRHWKEDKDMMKRLDRHEEREDEEEREHPHRHWKEDKDMMKRPDIREEREGGEEREHHHRRWKEVNDMMKRPHRPEEGEDDEEREHHHHRHHHHHFGHHHDHEDEEEERHGGEGIFKRIRKFLNHF